MDNKVEAILSYLKDITELGLKVYRTVEEHQEGFLLFQNELPKVPGVSLFKTLGNDLSWLSVSRQKIPKSPNLPSTLKDWVKVSSEPGNEPEIIDQRSIIEDENHRTINFHDDKVRESAFKEYFEKWTQWAEEVNVKKKAQALFEKLFKVNEKLKYDEQLELVWGHGLFLWKNNKHTIKYPLVTQRMVIEHRASDGVINIFPDDIEPKLELGVLMEDSSLKLPNIRKEFTEALHKIEEPTSKDSLYPLDFCLPILKKIAGLIPPGDGEFINEISKLPDLTPDSKPCIINCWTLFLRKRRQDAVMQDIETFKNKIKGEKIKSIGSLLPLIREPENRPSKRTEGRKFDEWGTILNKQILFPLPANEEQVQILDRFYHSDGVLVWGPPGTGKSHTIANLICHFMAEGKRVLVTSQKDQALSVLYDMIPKNLRSLCMSVFSNARNGRKKLDRAVATVTEIVTQSQPNVLQEKIKNFEDNLDKIHKKLITTEEKLRDLSLTQFRYIKFDGEGILPTNLIKRITKEEKKHAWFTDSPDYKVKIDSSNGKEIANIVVNYPLSDEEVEKLKILRSHLLKYLNDLSYNLPITSNLVDEAKFQKIVEDFEKVSKINKTIEMHIPTLVFKNENEEVLSKALEVFEKMVNIHKLITENWQYSLLAQFREDDFKANKIEHAIKKLNIYAEKLNKLFQIRDPLQSINLPKLFSLEEQKTYVEQVIDRLKSKKKIFNFFEKFSNRKKIHALKSVLINGKSPGSTEEWEDVLNYIEILIATSELKYQWNSFAQSINAPQLSNGEVTEQDTNKLLSLIKKLKSLFEYETICLPKAHQILGSLVVDADVILADATPEKIYKILKLKKEISSFHDSEVLRIKLKNNLQSVISKGRFHPVVKELMECLDDIHNQTNVKKWEKAYSKVKFLESLRPNYNYFEELLNKLSKQAPIWADNWKKQNICETEICPLYWKRSWWFQALKKYIRDISNGAKKISQLEERQNSLMSEVRQTKEKLILTKTKLNLVNTVTESQVMALRRWQLAVKKLGKRKGKYTWQKEKLVRKEMKQAKDAVPVWVMPLYKVSEVIPSEFNSFDVVIVDEASQCDIRALLALARGKKAIIVGDPEQISPDAVGIDKGKVQELIRMHLSEIPNKDYFDLETSLYDIANIALSSQGVVMLKEHFRCVPEIIEFCNKLCYDDKILPLRNPPPDKRLEPVLESVLVEGGHREGKTNVNRVEAGEICKRVQQMVGDPKYKGKTIGVISLLGNGQAHYIFDSIDKYITPEQQEECKFRVGDSYAFQGDERDVILLSTVAGPDDEKRLITFPYDVKRYRQRFNVAVSRARNKLVLFHSMKLADLKPNDLRYQLLYYIQNGVFSNKQIEKVDGKFESSFEKEVYCWLADKGYSITPQVKVGHYRIDLVVEGVNSRLGVECDGAKWHPPEKWWDDQVRQRQLERMGWTICRIWGTDFYQDPSAAMKPVLVKLKELGIAPSKTFVPDKNTDTILNSIV